VTTIGVLHPGEMGSVVAGAARGRGARALWTSEGRSGASRERAARHGLEDAGTLAALVRGSGVVASICPPEAALDLARQVAGLGFRGLYLDANAVSPATARAMADVVERAGGRFVDGGIVGPPPASPGTTRLYLSGDGADQVAALFSGTPLEAIVLDGGPGAASALKMAYAAWTKGSAALLLAVRALAVAEEVEDALVREWERSLPGLPARAETALRGNAPKAWRFVGEMEEIAATFEAAGLPAGFHQAAAEIYRALSPYRAGAPPFPEAAAALTSGGTRKPLPDSPPRLGLGAH
jgi:3-hydroxyisobutyrate dehydrogenase-like beta-hydroxyacid dehydrogenase